MLFATQIQAINPLTGELTLFAGPNVPGICFSDAENYCQNNGLGYCKVTGMINAVEYDDGRIEDFVFYN